MFYMKGHLFIMKTTIKKRLLRLGVLIGGVMGLSIVLVSLITLNVFSNSCDIHFHEYISDKSVLELIETEITQTKLFLNIALIGIFVALLTAAVIITIKVSEQISKSINESVDRLNLLSNGDVHTPFQRNTRGDETQMLSEAMERTVRRLNECIENIQETTSRFSNGDFTTQSNYDYFGDFEVIGHCFEDLRKEMKEIIYDTQVASEIINQNTVNLNEGATLLADNVTHEAATLQEINATMESVKTQISHTANSVTKASEDSVTVVNSAEEGVNCMNEVMKSMKEISKHAQGIEIVSQTTEDIASQIKLLSLNATIEAAHAGELGKSFAVVADEIRALAEKSNKAAQEAKNKVEASNKAIELGNEAARVANEKLNSIKEEIDDINNSLKSIRATSEEEAVAVKQVAQALDDITMIIQNNSATAEETAASCAELKGRADTMSQVISKFKI